MDPLTRVADGTEVAGRFKVISYIDRGGMASVYRAEQIRLGRRVALKILDESLAHDPGRVARFRREARDVAQLDHPHIVSVIDADESDGVFWIAMDLIEGTHLGRRLADRDEPISARELLAVLSQVASALDYAHTEHGLVHRDLKPANILIQASTGRAFLADFGIAAGREHTQYTAAGETMGTYRYVAPEQIRVDPHATVTPATDVYALAIVAYQGLTGAPSPYAGALHDFQMFHAHLYSDPVPLTGETPTVEVLNEVLATALAKDPDDRFQSAGEFVERLTAALGDRDEILDRRPGFPHPLAIDQTPEVGDGPVDATVLADEDLAVDDTAEIPSPSVIDAAVLEHDDVRVPLEHNDPAAPLEDAESNTDRLQQLIDELPDYHYPPPAPAAALRSTADLPLPRRNEPAATGPRTRRWPLLLVAGSIALPVTALALTDRPNSLPPTLTEQSAGAATLQVPTQARPIDAAPLLKAASLTAPPGASARGSSLENRRAAVVAIANGSAPMAPPNTTGKPDTVELGAGGRGRRYRTDAGTVTVASTPDVVVWLLCTTPWEGGPCAAATQSLQLNGEQTLQADPSPAIATTLRDALAAPRKARSELQLPVADLASRRGRAAAIADAYRRSAAALKTAAAERPRDRDLASLRAALQDSADAYDAIASASRRTGRGADRRARAQLRRADEATRTVLSRLQTRGYRVQA